MVDGLSKRITIRKGDTALFRFNAQSGGVPKDKIITNIDIFKIINGVKLGALNI